MNAQKAREITNKVNDEADKHSLTDIRKAIAKAAKHGLNSITIIRRVPERVLTHLAAKDGYTVVEEDDQRDQRDGYICKITW